MEFRYKKIIIIFANKDIQSITRNCEHLTPKYSSPKAEVYSRRGAFYIDQANSKKAKEHIYYERAKPRRRRFSRNRTAAMPPIGVLTAHPRRLAFSFESALSVSVASAVWFCPCFFDGLQGEKSAKTTPKILLFKGGYVHAAHK